VSTERPAEPAGEPSRFRQIVCTVCELGPFCRTGTNAEGTPACIDRRLRLARGEVLYRDGTSLGSLYAVRAGFLKCSAAEVGGSRHILRFLLPGDVAGLDGLGTGIHTTDAIALDDCEVCAVPMTRAQLLADTRSSLAAHLRALLSREIAQAQSHATTLATLTARQRIARFVLELASRWASRGYSPVSFRFPMSRRDIGNHLGLTIETVSRTLSEFRHHGWIDLTGRAIQIRDQGALRESATNATKLA
jgi:CRP/FNR family transcriptional regulator